MNKGEYKRISGKVVSAAMDKTIVVNVERAMRHPKYKKSYRRHKKYKVHDEKNVYKVGDMVEFVACRPISRSKRWRVLYKEAK